jgi:MerR family transcriptional regulator, heat shock protein HspR
MSDEKNEEVYYTIEVVTNLTRLGTGIIERCVQVGIVRPVETVRYSPADVARLRRVRRYIHDFGLNWAGIELVMRLTDEMEQMRAELQQLRTGRRPL